MAVIEPEILIGRRAFDMAQSLLAAEPETRLPQRVPVGWYDTTTDPEVGSFAVVQRGGDYEDLVGETLKITVREKSVFVYVIGARGVPHQIHLARRAFFALDRLSLDSLNAVVEITE